MTVVFLSKRERRDWYRKYIILSSCREDIRRGGRNVGRKAVIFGGGRHEELLLVSVTAILVPPRSENWSRSKVPDSDPSGKSSESTTPEDHVELL